MPNDPHSGGCVDADYNPIPCGDDNEPGGWNNRGGGWYDDDGNYHPNNEPNIPSFPSEVSVPGENTPTAGHGNNTPTGNDPRFSNGQNGPNGSSGSAANKDKTKGGAIPWWKKALDPFGIFSGGDKVKAIAGLLTTMGKSAPANAKPSLTQMLGSLGVQEQGLPSYDVGTNYVPQTGPAMVHEGEAIIPANQNTNANSITRMPMDPREGDSYGNQRPPVQGGPRGLRNFPPVPNGSTVGTPWNTGVMGIQTGVNGGYSSPGGSNTSTGDGSGFTSSPNPTLTVPPNYWHGGGRDRMGLRDLPPQGALAGPSTIDLSRGTRVPRGLGPTGPYDPNIAKPPYGRGPMPRTPPGGYPFRNPNGPMGLRLPPTDLEASNGITPVREGGPTMYGQVVDR